MKISLLNVKKLRIEVLDKLKTVMPNSELVSCIALPKDSTALYFTNIKKIYVNKKWHKDFNITFVNGVATFEFWTKEEIKEKLQTNNTWLFRGLMAIYNKQTLAEQANEMTEKKNDVGFTAFDAYFLTEMAKKIENKENFSTKQIQAIRKKMLKYSEQLLKIAQKKI